MSTQNGTLTEVIGELKKAAEADDKVAVGELIDAMDQRGYGPVLAVLPLVEISPLGGVPGFPTLLALLLFTLTARLLLGYEHFWAPQWLRKRELKSKRVITAAEWLKPVSARIDSGLQERLVIFAGATGRTVACVIILALLLTVPPLEVVPFATTIPMLIIAIFGLGLLYRDGLLMLIGFVGTALACGAGLLWLL